MINEFYCVTDKEDKIVINSASNKSCISIKTFMGLSNHEIWLNIEDAKLLIDIIRKNINELEGK